MDGLINGRTPEEIKRVLEWSIFSCVCLDCDVCIYNDVCSRENEGRLTSDALALIQHLEAERDAALAKVPKWISVEERLPEKPGTYGAFALGLHLVLEFDENEDWWDEEYNHYNGSITHWVPLLEPPEEGE